MNISIQRFIKIKIFFYPDVLINNAGIGIFTPFKERTAAELKKDESLIQFVEDRPGHDIRYRLDSSKLYEEARWRPQVNFEQGGISLTVNWCLKKRSWLFSKWSFIRKLYLV